MPKNKIFALAIAILTLFTFNALADNNPSTPTNAPAVKPAAAKGTNASEPKPAPKQSQSEVASKTATFGKISMTEEHINPRSTLIAGSRAQTVDKEGAFKGTVTAIFEPRSGGLAIMNFDKNYRSCS